jgi:hypothetical protein
VSDIHAQLKDWRTPADLQPASLRGGADDEAIQKITPKPTPSLSFEKLLPLLGTLNGGNLDITSVLDLLDKSGQGFGAFGKLLPLIAPLLQNGLAKKKPTEDTVDLSTINLD